MFDDNMNIRLIDFGVAAYCRGVTLTSYVGTDGYMAPEIHLNQKYLLFCLIAAWWLLLKQSRKENALFMNTLLCFLIFGVIILCSF